MKPQNVAITLHGREYRISSPFDEEYTRTLARYCDQQMKSIADATQATDYLGLSVLTMLQLAHNYFQARESAGKPRPEIETEVARLIALLEKTEKDAETAEADPAHPLNPNSL